MWAQFLQAYLTKKAAEGGKGGQGIPELPDMDENDGFLSSIMSMKNQANNMKPEIPNMPFYENMMDDMYKLKGGMAVNLGLPMDAFMTDEDFRRTGTTPYYGRGYYR